VQEPSPTNETQIINPEPCDNKHENLPTFQVQSIKKKKKKVKMRKNSECVREEQQPPPPLNVDLEVDEDHWQYREVDSEMGSDFDERMGLGAPSVDSETLRVDIESLS